MQSSSTGSALMVARPESGLQQDDIELRSMKAERSQNRITKARQEYSTLKQRAAIVRTLRTRALPRPYCSFSTKCSPD